MTRAEFDKLIADINAMRSMDRDGQEIEIAATIADSQTPSPDDLELDATLEAPQPMTRKAWRRYAGKLRMLARIKAECLPAINADRKAQFEIGANEGRKYVEEITIDYVQLWLDIARQPCPE